MLLSNIRVRNRYWISGIRILSCLPGLLAALSPLLFLAPVQAQIPSIETVPANIKIEAHSPRFVNWTRLPPIRINSARLVIATGRVFEWQVLERTGNFSIIKTKSNHGVLRYNAYAGPQPLNAAWYSKYEIGSRNVYNLRQIDSTLLDPEIESINGVDPRELAVVIRIDSETIDGPQSLIFRREVKGSQTVRVEVNGQVYNLMAFFVETVTERLDGEIRSITNAYYVPLLGIATQGRFLFPEEAIWNFDAIVVGPAVLRNIEQSVLP